MCLLKITQFLKRYVKSQILTRKHKKSNNITESNSVAVVEMADIVKTAIENIHKNDYNNDQYQSNALHFLNVMPESQHNTCNGHQSVNNGHDHGTLNNNNRAVTMSQMKTTIVHPNTLISSGYMYDLVQKFNEDMNKQKFENAFVDILENGVKQNGKAYVSFEDIGFVDKLKLFMVSGHIQAHVKTMLVAASLFCFACALSITFLKVAIPDSVQSVHFPKLKTITSNNIINVCVFVILFVAFTDFIGWDFSQSIRKPHTTQQQVKHSFF